MLKHNLQGSFKNLVKSKIHKLFKLYIARNKLKEGILHLSYIQHLDK